MPTSVTCRHCNAQFQVEDHLAGTEGRCPECFSLVQVPAIPPPLPRRESFALTRSFLVRDSDDSYSDPPRNFVNEDQDRSPHTPEMLQIVRSGLGMILTAALLYLLGQSLSILFLVVKGTEEGIDKAAQVDSGQLAIAIGSASLTAIASFFLAFGRKKCLAFNDPTPRIPILTSFICSSMSAFALTGGLIMLISGIIVIQQKGPADPLAGLLMLGGVFSLGFSMILVCIQEIAWPFFLVGMARSLENDRLRYWARLNLLGLVLLFGGGCLVMFGFCGYSVKVAAEHKEKFDAQERKKQEAAQQKKLKNMIPNPPAVKNKENNNPLAPKEEDAPVEEAEIPRQPQLDPQVILTFQIIFTVMVLMYIFLFAWTTGVFRAELQKLIPPEEEDLNRYNQTEY